MRSFKNNPSWSQFYAGGPEILAYFKATAAELNFEAKVQLNSRVSSCRFDESTGKWHVEITDSLTGQVMHDVGDLLVNGGGVLNKWKWPAVRPPLVFPSSRVTNGRLTAEKASRAS